MNEADQRARRALLKGLVLGGLGAAGAGFLLRSPRAELSAGPGGALSGRIFGLGADGRLTPEAYRVDPAIVEDRKAMSSLLSWLDLSERSTGRELLGVGGGHSVCVMEPSRLACIGQNSFWSRPSPVALVSFVRGASRPEVRYVETPPEVRTLGHGLYDPAKERLYVGALRRADDDEQGILLVIDPARARIESEVVLAGLRPHELAFTPDGREVAVCLYGEEPKAAKFKPSYSGRGAGLAFFSAGEFKHLRTLQGSTAAPVSHLTFDGHGDAYFLQHQGSSWKETEKLSGEAVDLAAPDLFDRFINEPRPLFRTRGGKVEEFWARKELQRRGLSITYNPMTDRVVATFSASDAFVVFDAQSEKSWAFEGVDIGLLNVSGALAIPGSSLVALSGFSHHLSLFDTRELRSIEVRKVAFHGASHLTYVP